MTEVLNTADAELSYKEIRLVLIDTLQLVDNKQFSEARKKLTNAVTVLENYRFSIKNNSELYLNDLYVINSLIEFFKSYIKLWEVFINKKFSESWNKLQDCLDFLRCIKKFSVISVDHFESQLLALEELYPYNVFFSIGATVDYYECGICGKDIDSPDCVHIKGELYSGEMATAIASNISQLDHVSLVLNPEDKRCTVQYDDNGEQFHVVRYLSGLLNDEVFPISHFKELQFSKVKKVNPDFVKQGRNEVCACGSGKKFKKCCINKQHIEGDHVEIVPKPFDLAYAIS